MGFCFEDFHMIFNLSALIYLLFFYVHGLILYLSTWNMALRITHKNELDFLLAFCLLLFFCITLIFFWRLSNRNKVFDVNILGQYFYFVLEFVVSTDFLGKCLLFIAFVISTIFCFYCLMIFVLYCKAKLYIYHIYLLSYKRWFFLKRKIICFKADYLLFFSAIFSFIYKRYKNETWLSEHFWDNMHFFFFNQGFLWIFFLKYAKLFPLYILLYEIIKYNHIVIFYYIIPWVFLLFMIINIFNILDGKQHQMTLTDIEKNQLVYENNNELFLKVTNLTLREKSNNYPPKILDKYPIYTKLYCYIPLVYFSYFFLKYYIFFDLCNLWEYFFNAHVDVVNVNRPFCKTLINEIHPHGLNDLFILSKALNTPVYFVFSLLYSFMPDNILVNVVFFFLILGFLMSYMSINILFYYIPKIIFYMPLMLYYVFISCVITSYFILKITCYYIPQLVAYMFTSITCIQLSIVYIFLIVIYTALFLLLYYMLRMSKELKKNAFFNLYAKTCFMFIYRVLRRITKMKITPRGIKNLFLGVKYLPFLILLVMFVYNVFFNAVNTFYGWLWLLMIPLTFNLLLLSLRVFYKNNFDYIQDFVDIIEINDEQKILFKNNVLPGFVNSINDFEENYYKPINFCNNILTVITEIKKYPLFSDLFWLVQGIIYFFGLLKLLW